MRFYSTSDWAQDVFAYDDYHSTNSNTDATLLAPISGVPYLVTEAVGALDGAPLYRWVDTEATLALQAKMHAQVHNLARANSAYSGLLGWAGIDYASLNGGGRIWHNVKWPGVLDTFRVPKPGAAFYRSQVDPAVTPVILPVFFWDFGPGSPASGPGAGTMIATNCDRLELYVGGQHFATGAPDTADYASLTHPPVIVDLTFSGTPPTELRIDGYLGAALVASVEMSADPTRDRLALVVEDASIAGDGNDMTRFTFRALDAFGNQRPYPTGDVALTLAGPATLIAENPFAFADYGGVGGGFIRSVAGASGTVTVTATHPTLGTASGTLVISPQPPPAPAGASGGGHGHPAPTAAAGDQAEGQDRRDRPGRGCARLWPACSRPTARRRASPSCSSGAATRFVRRAVERKARHRLGLRAAPQAPRPQAQAGPRRRTDGLGQAGRAHLGHGEADQARPPPAGARQARTADRARQLHADRTVDDDPHEGDRAQAVSRREKAIVVGLGAMGSATCLQLARRGVSVIGIDQYAPPHAYGSTHGDTRITRLAVGEGAEYIPLVQRSHQLWRELEEQSGARLLTQCGGVILSRPGSPFFEQTQALAQQFGIEHERLDNGQLRRRLPMFAVDEETEAYFEPSAGIVWPEAAVRVQLELARREGARLCLGERVVEWSASRAGVAVTTDAGTYAADRLVLSAGAWLPQLFPEGRELVAVYRQLLHWFEIREGYEQLREMPVFVWDFGGERGVRPPRRLLRLPRGRWSRRRPEARDGVV